MRAVMAVVPPDILEWRKRTGAHKFDEMWDGVLHIVPMPNRRHNDLEGCLETWLRLHWARPTGGKVFHQINLASVGGWPNDYRIPDLIVLTPERFAIDKNEYFEGAPEVVVEIRSPGDESYEKLEFYTALGIPEVWIIQRDSGLPEIHRLKEKAYELLPASEDGWVASQSLAVELRAGPDLKLAIRACGRPETEEHLPET